MLPPPIFLDNLTSAAVAAASGESGKGGGGGEEVACQWGFRKAVTTKHQQKKG